MRQKGFVLPHINDQQAINAHRAAVMTAFDEVFASINGALREALPQALNLFKLLDGSVDLAVHAPITRYIVKQSLARRNTDAVDEDEVSFSLKRVSNCGLCVQTPYGTVRVLKSTHDGLPKATSDARVLFSTTNQLVLEFVPRKGAERVLSLNLFVLWSMSSDYEYTGMQIACPRHVDDEGVIECYWITKWKAAEATAVDPEIKPVSDDLDEIKAVPADKTNAKKA